MYAKVRVKQKHTKAVDAVASKYEKFVSKVERVYTKRFRNIPRKRENGQVMENKIEPWPENGLFVPLVEAYMAAYMKLAKPKLGYEVRPFPYSIPMYSQTPGNTCIPMLIQLVGVMSLVFVGLDLNTIAH